MELSSIHIPIISNYIHVTPEIRQSKYYEIYKFHQNINLYNLKFNQLIKIQLFGIN